MSAHTPGPWYAVRIAQSNGFWYIDTDPDGENAGDIATIYNGDERAGNLNLIAAAPDLLAALRECALVLGDLPSTNLVGTRTRNAFYIARAAIAKAEGRT